MDGANCLISISQQQTAHCIDDERYAGKYSERIWEAKILQHGVSTDGIHKASKTCPAGAYRVGERAPLLEPLRDQANDSVENDAKPNSECDTLAEQKMPDFVAI